MHRAGTKEPSGVRVSAIRKTTTTEAWPNSWISPLDVPSGRGAVISAAYCMPTGNALVMKKPTRKAATFRPSSESAKVSQSSAGAATTSASAMNGTRLPDLSESADMTTAPLTPPSRSSAPRLPASTEENPRGRTISSTQVDRPLKTPIATKTTPRKIANGRTRNAWRTPTIVAVSVVPPSRSAGLGGRSRATATKNTPATRAHPP